MVLRGQGPLRKGARRLPAPRRGRGGAPLLRAGPGPCQGRRGIRAHHADQEVRHERGAGRGRRGQPGRPGRRGGPGLPHPGPRPRQHLRHAPPAAPRQGARQAGRADPDPVPGQLRRGAVGLRRGRRAAGGAGRGGRAGRRPGARGARRPGGLRRRGPRRRARGRPARGDRCAVLRPRPHLRRLRRPARRGVHPGAHPGLGRADPAEAGRPAGRRGVRPGRVRGPAAGLKPQAAAVV
ncbi:Protein dithiol-disulfide isomerase [Streptomyces misionensis JCM 4497]